MAPKRRRKQTTPVRFSRGRPYRRARAAFFNADPMNRLCVECLKIGITREATQLDHKQRAVDRPDLFFDPENFQGLCENHHEEKTARENSRK